MFPLIGSSSSLARWIPRTAWLFLPGLLTFVAGCEPPVPAHPTIVAAGSALAVSDALEALIANGTDTVEDREGAYSRVQALPANSAEDAFGRAAVAGRLAERKGALALLGSESPTSLAAEAETYARKSRKLDPNFRHEAAARMLGSLYVHAAAYLDGGSSEDGLEMLEILSEKHPEILENHVRLAEAYVFLGDKESSRRPLCVALSEPTKLRPDDAAMTASLAKELEGLDCKAILSDKP